MDVYAIAHGQTLVQQMSLPTGDGVRGVAVSPSTHRLYLSHGGDGGGYGNGALTAVDLLSGQVLWTRHFAHGVDSFAITPDGQTIYLPDGELTDDGKWYVVQASDGQEVGMIDTGVGTGDNGPHNTLVSLDGREVYLGDRNSAESGSNYFYVASTATNQIIRRVGPFKSGIRPFTVNGKNTLVYASVTGFLGFQVGDLTTGAILDTVAITPPAGVSCDNSGATDPSHGISLSPDERELYVLDFPCNEVHVFDVSQVPAGPPVQVANIPVTAFNLQETPCAYDCLGDGWLQHSRDGRFVYVGDSGDVIATATRAVVTNLAPLHNTRKMLEVDWQGGVPVFTTSRSGVGYVTS
jgi:DNA-binding beta-propeller fold protein YncE